MASWRLAWATWNPVWGKGCGRAGTSGFHTGLQGGRQGCIEACPEAESGPLTGRRELRVCQKQLPAQLSSDLTEHRGASGGLMLLEQSLSHRRLLSFGQREHRCPEALETATVINKGVTATTEAHRGRTYW